MGYALRTTPVNLKIETRGTCDAFLMNTLSISYLIRSGCPQTYPHRESWTGRKHVLPLQQWHLPYLR